MRNFLICDTAETEIYPLISNELYKRYPLSKKPIRTVDNAPVDQHAPPETIYPLYLPTPADKLIKPLIRISDYGTSFLAATESNPKLHTPALYLPPEAFFNEPATLAADIWTLGVSLYEVLGERPLFETFTWDRGDILGDMANTFGAPPQRWWNQWTARDSEFYEEDSSWRRGGIDIDRIYTPEFRRLHRRMWDMGRGETPETCRWDVEGGEMHALEELLGGVMVWEPHQRLTAEGLMGSEYMVKWAVPAWERQLFESRKMRCG